MTNRRDDRTTRKAPPFQARGRLVGVAVLGLMPLAGCVAFRNGDRLEIGEAGHWLLFLALLVMVYADVPNDRLKRRLACMRLAQRYPRIATQARTTRLADAALWAPVFGTAWISPNTTPLAMAGEWLLGAVCFLIAYMLVAEAARSLKPAWARRGDKA